jgi:disulfide bond formation protein DsbB
MPVAANTLARRNPVAAAAALVVAAGGATALLGAWFTQYVLHYQPCPLCLEQRIPYYVAVPLAVVVAVAALRGAPCAWVRTGLALLALAMLIGGGIALFHAGVEWKWWAGPRDCSGPLDSLGSPGGLLRELETINPVRCDEAPFRVLGLSLAGWNVLVSLALASAGVWGAVRSRPE